MRLPKLLWIVATVTGVPAVGFSVNAVRGFQGKYPRGGFGGVVWWTEHRVVHATLYGATCVAAALAARWAGTFLVADVTYAVLVGLFHHTHPP